MTGHWALLEQHIEHGNISIDNLMYDPATKQGVLNDFDLAREGGPNRKPTAKDNTGTMPFLALDLLNEEAFKGLVPRLYRHDAESFAWCLIYICVCMGKDDQGRIRTINPHPLSSWFTHMTSSYASKITLNSRGFLNELPLHRGTTPLVVALCVHWVRRYQDQIESKDSANLRLWTETVPAEESWREPSPRESLERVLERCESVVHALPEPQAKYIREKVATVRSLYALE